MWQTAGGRPHGAWTGVGGCGCVRGAARPATLAHTRSAPTPLRTDLTDGRDAPHHHHHHHRNNNTSWPANVRLCGPSPGAAASAGPTARQPRRPGPPGAAPPPHTPSPPAEDSGVRPRLDVTECKGAKVHLELQSVLMRYAFTI